MNKVFLLALLSISVFAEYKAGSPVSKYGKLKVQGLQLVSESGQAVQLRGMSTHGPQWFANCLTYESFTHMANVWQVDVVRIAMYVNENGYNTNPAYWKTRVMEMINWCEQLGLYALVDWHTLTPGDPNDGSYNEKWDFFGTISKTYSSKKHLLYEICNEPNGVQWSQVENYAKPLIEFIRQNDPTTIIIVGTPSWSSELWNVNPLPYSNLMYTLHFYAASHFVSDLIRQQAGRIPIFVTEFGLCTYSGDGYIDTASMENWLIFLNGNNNGGQKISFINWSFSDASESCAALNPGACNSRSWDNVKQSGGWVKDVFLRAH